MSTSGYYDEIAKVEALRRERLWRFRRRQASASKGERQRLPRQVGAAAALARK